MRWIVIAALALFATPVSANDSQFAKFSEYLEEFRKESGTPSLSALIIKDQEIVWEGYFGYYDDEGDLPTRAETTYKIASVTKPIAAAAILAEAAQGGLSLDTPMASDDGWTELCEFFVANTPIPFMAGGEDRLGNPIAPMDCSKATTLTQMLDMRANGEAFVYNPIAFARIDRAILGAGGRDLREIVRERVADPAGMEDTALGWRDPQGGAALRFLAEPFHVVDGRPVKQPLPDDDFRAAAGMIASPRSIAQFDIALDSGELVVGTDGEPLTETLASLPIGPLGDYRSGWFLEDWDGQRLMCIPAGTRSNTPRSISKCRRSSSP